MILTSCIYIGLIVISHSTYFSFRLVSTSLESGFSTPILDTAIAERIRSRVFILTLKYRYVLFDKGQRMQVNSEPFLLDNKKYDIDLSIVVPAYNEVDRLPKMMDETLPVLLSLSFLNSITLVLAKKNKGRETFQKGRNTYCK